MPRTVPDQFSTTEISVSWLSRESRSSLNAREFGAFAASSCANEIRAKNALWLSGRPDEVSLGDSGGEDSIATATRAMMTNPPYRSHRLGRRFWQDAHFFTLLRLDLPHEQIQ